MIMSEGSKCPYCGSVFESKKQLSTHIDKIHNNEDSLSTQGF